MTVQDRHVGLDETLPVPALARERRRLQLYGALMAIDALMITLGIALGGLLRLGDPLAANSVNMAVLLVPLYYAIALNNHSYSEEMLRDHGIGIAKAFTALLSAAVAVVFIAFYTKSSADFSRFAFSVGTVASALLIAVARRAFAPVGRWWCGGEVLSAIVILDGGAAPPVPGAQLIDAAAAGLRPDMTDPLALDRIGRYLRHADRVVVSCVAERRFDWAMALKGANIAGEIIDPAIAELGAIGTRRYGEVGALVVSAGALGLRSRLTKRLLDMSLALIGLVLLAPLFLVVAALIKLHDGGPVLFVQERLGRGNRLFLMYKFRSMRVAAGDAAGTLSTARHDQRITPIGRFIRATSIDELPQIANVLRGDMSLVGPRPHALGSLAGDKLFWEVDPRYWHRHASKPGLTGLAQVRGFRGATHEQADLTQRLQADLEYMSGWTLWRDIRILFATLRVLIHRNAF